MKIICSTNQILKEGEFRVHVVIHF